MDQQYVMSPSSSANCNEQVVTQAYTYLQQVPIPLIPSCLKLPTVLNELCTFNNAAILPYKGFRIAAHACFWAPCDKKTLFGHYNASVMMHLRFDGTMGFFGGLIEQKEDLLVGLHRELKEEANYCPYTMRPITYLDYHSTRVLRDRLLVLHLFVVKLTMPQFEQLERAAVTAQEYGKEVFGTIRVPLYTMENGYDGLPAFLNNRFVGCAKQSLLMVLYSCGLLTDQQVTHLMELAPGLM